MRVMREKKRRSPVVTIRPSPTSVSSSYTIKKKEKYNKEVTERAGGEIRSTTDTDVN